MTVVYPDLLGFWMSHPALPPAHTTEQAFQSLHRIFEANCAVTRAFYDMAQRQQDFALAATEATLAGLPGAMARHIDIALASVGNASGQTLRMLRPWTSTMLGRSTETVAAAQHPATP
jgi:hypothetical protein